MVDIYENIEEHNLNKENKILIVLDDMIADMFSNKKLNPMVTELFIRGRKLNISLVLWRENIKLNSAYYFNMKIPNKWELQWIAFNHSSDFEFRDLMSLYNKCSGKPYSFQWSNSIQQHQSTVL